MGMGQRIKRGECDAQRKLGDGRGRSGSGRKSSGPRRVRFLSPYGVHRASRPSALVAHTHTHTSTPTHTPTFLQHPPPAEQSVKEALAAAQAERASAQESVKRERRAERGLLASAEAKKVAEAALEDTVVDIDEEEGENEVGGDLDIDEEGENEFGGL